MTFGINKLGYLLAVATLISLVSTKDDYLMTIIQTVNDSYTFTLDSLMPVHSGNRRMPLYENYYWNVAFRQSKVPNYYAVALTVPFVIDCGVKATISIEGSPYVYVSAFDKFELREINKNIEKISTNKTFITREQFYDVLRNCTPPHDCQTVTIRCEIKFYLKVPSFQQEWYKINEHIKPDFDLVLGDGRIKTHRHFLSLISPIFNEIMSNSTELMTELRIDNFTFATIKTAMNLCYGHPFENLTPDLSFEILRFAETYDIKKLHMKIAKTLMDNVSSMKKGSGSCSE